MCKKQAILTPLDITPRNSASSTVSGVTAASSGSARAPITLMHESMANNPLQTERDLIKRQEYVMKQQDLALADIEKGVGRLKNKVRSTSTHMIHVLFLSPLSINGSQERRICVCLFICRV